MGARRAPTGKRKLITVHVDNADVTPGYVEFLTQVLMASATRSQHDLERSAPGDPIMHTNAAGDLVVYATSWTI